MTEVQELYKAIVLDLYKAEGNSIPRGYLHSVNVIHDRNEAKALKVLLAIIRKARMRFLRKFKKSVRIAKASNDDSNNINDIRDEIRAIMASAFANASDDLLEVLEGCVNELAHNFSSVHQVDLNYNLINKDAVAYLKTNTDDYFSTLSDDTAEGIKRVIGDTLAGEASTADAEGRYTIRDIVSNIASTWGKSTIDFPTKTLAVEDWALITARDQTARASSASTKAVLQSLDLKMWQWCGQGDSACDDCQDNLDEIQPIGEPFTSGSTEPPEHPQCRCVCIALSSEISGLSDDEEPTSD
jgi:hypothetical protein